MLRSIPECKVFYITFEEINRRSPKLFMRSRNLKTRHKQFRDFETGKKVSETCNFISSERLKNLLFVSFLDSLIIFEHLTLNASVSLVFDRSPFLKYIKKVVILRIKWEVRLMKKRWSIGTIPELRQVSTLPFKSTRGPCYKPGSSTFKLFTVPSRRCYCVIKKSYKLKTVNSFQKKCLFENSVSCGD